MANVKTPDAGFFAGLMVSLTRSPDGVSSIQSGKAIKRWRQVAKPGQQRFPNAEIVLVQPRAGEPSTYGLLAGEQGIFEKAEALARLAA